jgi:hypothetical protein
MGREQPQLGETGELLVVDFLRRSFLNVGRTQSGAPLDLNCSELRVESRSRNLHPDPTLQFLFQVKTTEQGRSFEVARSTFQFWLTRFECQPIILLIIEPHGIGRQSFWFLTLHDWLLSPPGQAALADHQRRKIVFKSADGFARCDLDGVNFHTKMIEEADRASAALTSPWATLRDYGLLPLDEGTFLEYIELARFAETPIDISVRLASYGSSARHRVRELIEGYPTGDVVLRNWIRELACLAPQPNATSFQRSQFTRFTRALRHYEKGVHLPRFRVAEVNLWRSFVAMYPHSLKMLDHIVRSSTREHDLMFASALLPTLALSNNAAVSASAHDTIRKLQARRNDFRSYAFQREMYRGSAESGNREHLRAGIDFMFRRSTDFSELRFLTRYGWAEELLSDNLKRKLHNPTRRDHVLGPWYEHMADALL